ncbi:MAG: hypothetical protein HY236_00310, partial [Acidobacteria bacterium]|nr:hypothetical protein [Acidobacteriota bacterium]
MAARLTVWYAGSGLALVLITTGFMYWLLITNLGAEDDHFLADKVHILRHLLRDRPEDAAKLKYETEREWAVSRYMQVSVRILDEAGRTEVETPGMDR